MGLGGNIMYKLLRQNFDNYREINDYESNKEEYRMKMTDDLIGLVDKEEYMKLKIKNNDELRRVENLVYKIAEKGKNDRKFEKLAFELWAYGYEKKEYALVDNEMLEEQLKLIDMFNKNVYI